MTKHQHRINEVKSYLIPFASLPRPVFWFHDSFEGGTWSDLHQHEHWGELAVMKSGYMVVCTELGNYLAPPQRAVWIPPGLQHEWYLPEPSTDCSLYIRPECLHRFENFTRYHSLELTPLVREIIHTLSTQPREYETGPVSRLVEVLLDQLPLMQEVGMPVPMPKDYRLVGLCTALIKEPDLGATIRQWCKHLGMSERTLARQFQRETGESFGKWRQRMRLQYASTQLDAGENVTSVALSCGYGSVSAFIAAYKKIFGHTPGQKAKKRTN